MSDIPPPPPGGQDPLGGQTPPGGPPPPAGGYGQQPPGYQPAAQPSATPGWSGPPLAEFQDRVVPGLIDFIGPWMVASIVYWFISGALGALLGLAGIGWALYNGYLSGESGQSIGMKTGKVRLVSQQTGQHIGGGLGLARYLLHMVAFWICFIPGAVNLLFPLFDPMKQTGSDKILKTVVIKEA